MKLRDLKLFDLFRFTTGKDQTTVWMRCNAKLRTKRKVEAWCVLCKISGRWRGDEMQERRIFPSDREVRLAKVSVG